MRQHNSTQARTAVERCGLFSVTHTSSFFSNVDEKKSSRPAAPRAADKSERRSTTKNPRQPARRSLSLGSVHKSANTMQNMHGRARAHTQTRTHTQTCTCIRICTHAACTPSSAVSTAADAMEAPLPRTTHRSRQVKFPEVTQVKSIKAVKTRQVKSIKAVKTIKDKSIKDHSLKVLPPGAKPQNRRTCGSESQTDVRKAKCDGRGSSVRAIRRASPSTRPYGARLA